MGTIREVKKKDGVSTFHAEVRLRGYPAQRESFRTRSLAKKWIQDTESAIRDGRHFRTSESKRHTVGDLIDRFVDQWLPRFPKGIAKQTALLSWWKGRLGYLLLADLTPAAIAEARDTLLSQTTIRNKIRSPATVNRYLASFSKALTIGIKEFGWLEDNPMGRVSKPAEGKGRDRLLTLEEKDRLLEFCKVSPNPHLYPIVCLAFLTGMRYGEIVRLQWEDIDRVNRTITIRITKNGETRILPLTEAVQNILAPCRETDICSGLIFKPMHHNNKSGVVDIREPFQTALRKANVKNLDSMTFVMLPVLFLP